MQIDTAFFLEFVRQVFDQTQVKVFTTKEGVTVGRQNFKLLLAVYVRNFDDRDIECTTTQVVYRDSTVTRLLVDTVRQRRCSWLVDNTLDFEARDFTGVFCCLTL